MNRIARIALVSIVCALAAACSAAPSRVPAPANPAVGEARATEIATSALEAYNAGDYAGWTRDWSAAMRSAISEKAWQASLPSSYATFGRFVAIQGAELISYQAGTYGYTFTVQFEKRVATVRFVFVGDSTLVEGVHVA